MTIPRLESMSKYWQDFPPLHVNLTRITHYLGIGVVAKKAETNESGQSLFDLFPQSPKR